jgi:AraC-like DNA-binding protein
MNPIIFIKKSVCLKNNKIVFFCLTALPLFLVIFPIIALYNRTFTVFPADDIGNRISGLTDSIWNGRSRIEEFGYNANAMVLKYTLKKGAPSPLVFVTIKLGSIENPLDISHFNSVSIRIKEATNKRVTLFIKTFVPGISLPESEHANTLRHNQYILQLTPARNQYTIKLKDFVTPTWWIEEVKVNKTLLPQESFTEVMNFDLQFNQEGSDYRINKPENIIIENISFRRTISLFNYALIGLVILYYTGFGGFLIRRKMQKKRQHLPERKSLELSSYREKELLQIKEFIQANYNVVDVSTRKVSETMGIPSSRVFELIKEEYHLTFKQLINRMRIDEAKRLLKETDLRVTDIALNLGFNNVSYFNNLFKMYVGETPSDYREKREN